jgi:hypothetical protein
MMSGGKGGWGQKVLSKPSADSFAVGRRQKELKSFLHSLTIRDKVASGDKGKKAKITELSSNGPKHRGIWGDRGDEQVRGDERVRGHPFLGERVGGGGDHFFQLGRFC